MLTEEDIKAIEQEFIELTKEHGNLWDILPGNDKAYARCQEIVKRQQELSRMLYDGMEAIIQGSKKITIPMRPAHDEKENGSRFWIDDNPEVTPFRFDNCGVVDEEAGGIVAYFSNEDDAKIFIKALECEGK